MTPEKLTRRQFLYLTPLLMAGAALACSRADVPIEKIPGTPTPEHTHTPTTTPSPAPTETQTVVVEPTPTRVERTTPLIHELLGLPEEGQIKLSIDLGGKDYTREFTVLWYRDNFTQEEKKRFDERWAAGNGAGFTESEDYGNSLIYVHSGNVNNKPLEAEPIRLYLEGYKDETVLNVDYIKEKMRRLEGKRVSISHKENSINLEIVAVAQIPHEAIVEFKSDTKNVLNVIIEKGIGNVEGFEEFKTQNSVFITFCGWGQESASRDPNSVDWRYSYTQYVLGLRLI